MNYRTQSRRVPLYPDVYRPSYNDPAHDESESRNFLWLYDPEQSECKPVRIPIPKGHHLLGPNTRSQRGTSTTNNSGITPRNTDHDRPPKLWDEELDELIDSTVRAYDLVVHYEEDSYGGKRWSREDITEIYEFGKGVHQKQEQLKKWQRVVLHDGDQDEETISKIREDAENMRAYCKQIKRTIAQHEQVQSDTEENNNGDDRGLPIEAPRRSRWGIGPVVPAANKQEHTNKDNKYYFDESGFPRRSRWGLGPITSNT